MKLVIVTAAWQRHDLFELFCRYYATLQQDIPFTMIVACSERTTYEIAQRYWHLPVMVNNSPLSNKFNTAMQMAEGADYVLNIGSDDFIPEPLLRHYIKLFDKGYDYIYTLDWDFFDTRTKKGIHWFGYDKHFNKGKGCGAGRVLSGRLLEKMHWRPWVGGYENVLDTAMQHKLDTIEHTKHGFKLNDIGLYGIDIKTSTNMTPFELWDNSVYVDGRELLKKALPDWADEIYNL